MRKRRFFLSTRRKQLDGHVGPVYEDMLGCQSVVHFHSAGLKTFKEGVT